MILVEIITNNQTYFVFVICNIINIYLQLALILFQKNDFDHFFNALGLVLYMLNSM